MDKYINSKIHFLQSKYENYVGLTASRKTAIRYSKALDAFFRHFKDKKSPDDFSRADVEDFRIIRLREKISPTTINYECQIVRSFWQWLMRMSEAEWNPASTMRRLKEVEPVRTSMSEPDQMKLYATSEQTGVLLDKLLVGLALSTGLRAETLYQLDTNDIDFENRALRIPALKMKSRRNLEIPLRDRELDIIRGLPVGRLFNGYAASAKSISYKFSKLCKRSGVAFTGIRTARRTFATTLLRNGADLRMVQDFLSHRNISTTSKYLTPADTATAREALNRLPSPPVQASTPPVEVTEADCSP